MIQNGRRLFFGQTTLHLETLQRTGALLGMLGSVATLAFADAAKSASSPLEELTRRNPFRPLIVAAPAPKVITPVIPVAPPAPKIPIAQQAARWRLVGILPGTPMQAILEDAQTRTTVYAVEGQLLGELRVDRVLSDRMAVSVNDEHLELML